MDNDNGDNESKPSSAAKASIEVKQLQRYYTVLRDFMAHFHKKDEIYPPNHEFTQDELGAVTPSDIIRWMNMKLYNTEEPGDDDRPLNGSHHTLDYYKKSISYFMPQKETSWDHATKAGNPTRSAPVNNLIGKVRMFDFEVGGAKRRKTMQAAASRTSVPTLPSVSATDLAAAMTRTPAGGPGGMMASTLSAARPGTMPADGVMHGILLRRMHAQNASFIDLFGTLSNTIEAFKTSLQANNHAIMNEISCLDRVAPAEAARGMHGVADPPDGTNGDHYVGGDHAGSGGVGPGTAGATTLDWQYVHPDGVRRRVPPTWSFPHCNLQDMYMLWHCGDYQNRISPMKSFDNSDVNFLGKRARMNLNEVKNLMATIDEEASRKGLPPSLTMTLAQASTCFRAGLGGFNFSSTTPTGKQRNILRLKWSTLTKYDKKKASASSKLSSKEDNNNKEDETEPLNANEKARQEFIIPSASEALTDNWWYEHNDGAKRRVPSTFSFPMLGLEDMYVLWHCGDERKKISPMKLFQDSDLCYVTRGKKNFDEIRAIMTTIDLEVARRGLTVKSVMTVDEAKECVDAGYSGLNIPTTTPDGRDREILRMKWSSAVRLKTPAAGEEEGEGEEEKVIPEAEETELPEAEMDV